MAHGEGSTAGTALDVIGSLCWPLRSVTMNKVDNVFTDLAGEFRQTEVLCSDEASAALEAKRRQVDENPAVEWIYLRNKDRVWVARRTLRDGSAPEDQLPSRGFCSSVVHEIKDGDRWDWLLAAFDGLFWSR